MRVPDRPDQAVLDGFLCWVDNNPVFSLKAIMPNRSYVRNAVDRRGFTYATNSLSSVWENSQRSPVTGKLVLTPHTFTYSKRDMMSTSQSLGPGGYCPTFYGVSAGSSDPRDWSWSGLDNECYARFQGRLRKGSASLGVTAASWKQSRDMIVNSSNHLRRTLDSTIAHLQGNRGALKRLKRERDPLANRVLEVEFGWRPLFSDLHSALFTVCKDGIPPEWITSRARTYVETKQGNPLGPTYITEEAHMKVSYSAKVVISNPNLWLLNRLGLINPLTVAWDLIPWSFVVNMFLNVNSMIGSITDEVGLDISGRSVTRTSLVGREYLQYDSGGRTFERQLLKAKNRELGAQVRPHWELKVPNLNWELALIASSLVVQRFKTINNLIRVF